MRKQLQVLASKEDLALLTLNPGLYFRSISARSCKEEPSNQTGEYLIQPTANDKPFLGYCDQTTLGGGWLVFQYRYDGSVDFWRNWDEYRNGFGSMDEEFWLGLEQLHRITTARKHELLVELKDFDGKYIYARYDEFEIGSEEQQYPLKKLGSYNAMLQVNPGILYRNVSSRSCVQEQSKHSGKYIIQATENDYPFVGYCDQTTLGGGWLVFQYRYEGSVDFWRNWIEYRDGFGSMDGEFWLGLEKLHRITTARKHELLVELKDFDGKYIYARAETCSAVERCRLGLRKTSGAQWKIDFHWYGQADMEALLFPALGSRATPLTDGLERRNHPSKLGFSPRWISSDQPSNAGVDAILCILILTTTQKKQQKKALRRMLPKERRELFSLHRGHNYRNRNVRLLRNRSGHFGGCERYA
uniref:Fibrinogen C-terminal domain-containing protein n=1 Tax=Anopheles coluzzii TaxID=1518534 RepID=A0A8W7PWV3_ANOCL